MWANCRAYNPEGTIVRQMGDRLSDTWEKKWYQQGVEAKWEGLMRELKEEDVRTLLLVLHPPIPIVSASPLGRSSPSRLVAVLSGWDTQRMWAETD